MARRSLPSFVVLWQRHESLYCEVFMASLGRLAKQRTVTGDEDAISERLCPILAQVCFELGQAKNLDVSVPSWEAPIQPVINDELAGGKKRKRPDFTCKLVNPHANVVENYELAFHVECKRLGNPTSPTWVLNKNYVTNGIQRFDNTSHEYGKRVASGMMIGYAIDMGPRQILKEVNGFLHKNSAYMPTLNMNFGQGAISQHRQNLDRMNVKPRQFSLIHMWVDIRHNYQS